MGSEIWGMSRVSVLISLYDRDLIRLATEASLLIQASSTVCACSSVLPFMALVAEYLRYKLKQSKRDLRSPFSTAGTMRIPASDVYNSAFLRHPSRLRNHRNLTFSFALQC